MALAASRPPSPSPCGCSTRSTSGTRTWWSAPSTGCRPTPPGGRGRPSTPPWPAGPPPPGGSPRRGDPTNPIFTALPAATLHRRKVEHPWLDGADDWLWRAVDQLDTPHPYDVRALLTWPQEVPDRTRVEAALDRVGPLMEDPEMVALDPDAQGEVHLPSSTTPPTPTRWAAASSPTRSSRPTSTTSTPPSATTACGPSTPGWSGRRWPKRRARHAHRRRAPPPAGNGRL